MKILKENKEKLPIDFLTQFVSTGWNEVGNLKASIQAIKDSFKETSKVEKILTELVDAYLIAIGQAELYMQDKDYVDAPAKEEIKESLKEETFESEQNLITEELPDVKTLEMGKEKEETSAEEVDNNLEPDLDIEEDFKNPVEAEEGCDWFCDFDEPVGEQITDAELYGNR